MCNYVMKFVSSVLVFKYLVYLCNPNDATIWEAQRESPIMMQYTKFKLVASISREYFFIGLKKNLLGI